MNEKDLSWIAGVLDGEGSINVSITKHSHYAHGYEIMPRIAISVSRDDAEAIFQIKKLLGFGNVDNKTRHTTTFYIHKKADIKRFIDIVEPYVRFPSTRKNWCYLNK